MLDDLTTTIRRLQAAGDHDAVLDVFEREGGNPVGYPALLKGISLALRGRLDDARPLLLEDFPLDHGYQKSDAGLAAFLLGDLPRARDLLADAAQSEDADAITFGRLAVVFLGLGDLEKARELYQEAVEREPGRAEWHSNLAGILARQQKLEEALENYDIALRLKPDMMRVVSSRERVMVALERSAEVVEQLREELQKDPENVATRVRLARALAQDNAFPDAVAVLREALHPVAEVVKPDAEADGGEAQAEEKRCWEEQIRLRAVLADLFATRDRHGAVIAVVNEIEKLYPVDPVPFACQKAMALSELGRHDDARAVLDELGEEHADAKLLIVTKALLCCQAGGYEEAERLQRGLLDTYPGDSYLKAQLGATLLWIGKLDEAADLFEQASQVNPMALTQMVNARRFPEDEASLRKMQILADNALLPDEPRVAMGFALAEVHDKRKEYDAAFRYLTLANRLTDKQLKYDPEEYAKQIATLKGVYTAQFFARQPRIRSAVRVPIFVVGMPRSGTTLTEQILCSHPEIFGAGELDFMPRIAQLMPRVMKSQTPYPLCLEGVTPYLREKAALYYINRLNTLDRSHRYVVDKLPHNFERLGLIALIFPGAKIIHIQRDPRDTALSNFQQNFKAKHGGLGYAFDLEKIADQINDYHRMMEHWRAVLPLPMFELTYEELVADQEGMTRQLLDFVGVGWSDSVRDFHKTERAVRTASVSQVRQPIYQTSRQKWRRYESHLAPLLERLRPEVTAPWDGANSNSAPPLQEGVRLAR